MRGKVCHVFSCALLDFHVTSFLPLVASESLRLYCQNYLSLVNDVTNGRNIWRQPYSKHILLARFLLSSELHRTMQLTKTYTKKRLRFGWRAQEVAAAISVLEALRPATCAPHHQAFEIFPGIGDAKLASENPGFLARSHISFERTICARGMPHTRNGGTRLAPPSKILGAVRVELGGSSLFPAASLSIWEAFWVNAPQSIFRQPCAPNATKNTTPGVARWIEH